VRKAGIAVLFLAVTAGAVLGVIRTGFLQKAVWVFQGTSQAAPGPQASPPGPADGTAVRPGAPNGGFGERRGGPGGGNGGSGTGHGPEGGAPQASLNLANVGWFALILAFFAIGTALLGVLRKRLAGRRGRSRA